MGKIEENKFGFERSGTVQELDQIWQALFRKKPMAFYGKVRAFEQALKKSFPDDYINHEMYYVLNGTSAYPSFPLKKDDFPGKFSVREFLLKAEKDIDEWE